MLFYKTYFEDSNINRNPLIWSKYKKITKFGKKKMREFGFGKVYENCPKIKKKVLFYKSYFEEGNINQKPLTWSHYKIITKFGQIFFMSLVLGKVNKNSPKIKEKRYFTKLTSKRVISSRNHLFGPNISQ